MKFRTRLLQIVIIALLVIHPAFSQQAVHIQTNSTGVRISVRGLQAAIKPTGNNGKSSAWITNSRYAAIPSDKNGAALQILRITIAIPYITTIKPDLSGFRVHTVATASIARSSEFFGKSSASVTEIFHPNFVMKPSVSLRIAGIQRGVQIADIEIQPFDYSSSTGELSILDSAEIDIPFTTVLPKNFEELISSERGVFSGIANLNQISAIRQLKAHEEAKAPRPLSVDSINTWYNPQTTYLRIATTTDGVALLSAKNILASAPEWNGLSTSGLHLLYKGKEYPLGLDDIDGKIDSGDEYFFAGRRAVGDSTWQNCITPDAVFYLYHDPSTIGKRFGQFPNVPNPKTEIQSVSINKHIEEDHFHYWGDDDPNDGSGPVQYKSDVLFDEGFYWSNLNNNIYEFRKLFTYNIMVAPSDQKDDILQSQIVYHTNTRNYFTEPNYTLISGINSQEHSRHTTSGAMSDSLAFTMPSSDYLGGVNRLYVKSDTVSKDNSGRDRVGDAYINYITLSGNVKPFAEMGKSDFKINAVSEQSYVTIRGFRAAQVIVIDTVNSLFSSKTGTSGTTVRAGATGGQTPRISIVLNDTVLVSADSSALYVAIADAPTFTNIRTQRFDQSGGGLRGFINTAPAGSIVVAASNLPSLSQEIKQIFEELGSREINQVSANETWTGAFLKGKSDATREKRRAISSIAEFIPHIGGQSYQADIALAAGTKYSLQSADVLSAEIPSISRELNSNLHDTLQQFDAIIITHSNFKDAAERLATYRASLGWKIKLVRVEDIYKEFYGGEKSPHAIKAFLKYAYDSWQKPTPSYLTMFGDASWDPRKFEYNSTETDYLPSYGSPVSDFWFTLLDGKDLIPEMSIGRIPVRNMTEANDMVDKLIEYDASPAAPWKKNFLFLSGGSGIDGRVFYSKFDPLVDYLILPPICGDTARIRGDLGVEFAKPTTIRNAINDGAVWLSFFGHSAPTIFDLDGWAVEDLNNRGRYNLLATYSCNSGAFANPYGIARNESYVITPHKGSIGAMGSTGIGIVNDDASIQFSLHRNLAEDTVRLLGDILNKAKRGWEKGLENTLMQYALIGDPLTRLTLDNKPDLYSLSQETTITLPTGETIITEVDSAVNATFAIRNAGIGNDLSIPILLVHRYPSGADSLSMTLGELCSRETLSTPLIVKNRPGTHTFTVIIDPNAILDEVKRNNNATSISFEVFSAGLAALDPQPFWDVDVQKPAFRLVQPQLILQAEYEFMIRAATGDTIAHSLTNQQSQELTLHEAFIEWMPRVNLIVGQSYTLSARIKNLANEKTSTWLNIPFHAVASQQEYIADWKQQSKQEILTNSFRDIISEKHTDSTYRLRLNTYPVPLSVTANNGFDRYAKIRISTFEPIGFNTLTRFNVAHLTPRDTSYKYFDFETFYNQKLRSGDAADVVNYLRDSVQLGDVIIIGASDGAFNSFLYFYHPDSTGSMKSLSDVLHKYYGATLIDSVYFGKSTPAGDTIANDVRHATSYALIARKDTIPHSIKEVYDFWKNTVSLEDTLPFYSHSGEIYSPVIGPAADWDSLHINAIIPPLSSIKVEIYGKKNSSDQELLLKTDSASSISLHDIAAKDYPYLRIKTLLTRTHYKSEPTVSDFECFYKPTVEYALLPSRTFVTDDNLLRGDTSTFNFELMNIAKRGLPDSSDATVSIRPEDGSGRTFSYYHPLPKLLSGDVIGFTDTLPSNELATTSRIQPEIDAKNQLHEIYRFNNKSSSFFHIREDSINPHIELRVDGIAVKDYDYIAPEPLLEIIIHDNSNLLIDSAKIRIRVNRFIQPDTTSLNAKFERIKGQGDSKARLSFITKRLEEENIIQITVEDASANKDTLKIYLNVSKNGAIKDVLAIPTPTDLITTLRFNYIGQEQDSPATLDIFSITGEAVRSLTTNVRIGSNTLIWDGNNRVGDNVPSGIYFYRLNVQAPTYSEPFFGKIMITR